MVITGGTGGCGEVEEGKEGQIYGYGRRFHFG